MTEYRKKLIEVALPLEAINRESAREKSIRHGHPSTLHLWWARRPLAACRAVLFASIVDDPSSQPNDFPTEEDQERERQRLFRIIEELVKWENSNNDAVLDAARAEIMRATDGNPPPVLDPFCGGGSIPLEAQRLGLEAHASDLNPVAVLITKALVEIPPKFANRPPINPEAGGRLGGNSSWRGAQGLAEDIRHYGKWLRDEALKRIGHLYPRATLPDGRDATVLAWLWARTVRCPNPACGHRVPLVRSFALSKKKGKESHVEPVAEPHAERVSFRISPGDDPHGGTVSRQGAKCLVCGSPIPFDHIREEGRRGQLEQQLMAIVAEGTRARTYLPPDNNHEAVATSVRPHDPPETDLPPQAPSFRVQAYGMTKHRHLFTPRQLVALETFSGLVSEIRAALASETGDLEYADALATYLAFAVDRVVMFMMTLCIWSSATKNELVMNAFVRHAVPMTWDFAEANPFGGSAGDLTDAFEWVAKVVERLPAEPPAEVSQLDAMTATPTTSGMVVTDPPYYDNVGYSDLSDLFYVWLRRSMVESYPALFSTLLVPKAPELVANPFRFEGGARAAQRFFEHGLTQAFSKARDAQDERYPFVFFYAFLQAEEDGASAVSTGWEKMLEGLLAAGFRIVGTWPVRTERPSGVKVAINALASSIVLICRERRLDAELATRRDFVNTLRSELPPALRMLQRGSIAPVDLAQAAIGPGMAVFSRYAKVLEADGQQMTVRAALGLVNQTLGEILGEQEGDFDPETRFAVTWFEQRGMEEGPFGEADVLARAKNTAVQGLADAGVLISRGGKVRLLRRDELPEVWDPAIDRRVTIWEASQHLIKRLEMGGEQSAADLLRRLGGLGETARQLAYRLYTTSERKGWSQEALAYNALVVAWPEIARRVAGTPEAEAQQVLEI